MTWMRFEGSTGHSSPSETEFLLVTEIDEHLDALALVVFDADDFDVAHALLDARWRAGDTMWYGHAVS